MFHAIQIGRFGKKWAKREFQMRDREKSSRSAGALNFSFLAIGYPTHSAMTFLLNRVNQNVDTLCVMLLLFRIIDFKETKDSEGERGERDEGIESQAWTQAVVEGIGYAKLFVEM